MGSSSLKATLDAELRFQRKQWRIERIGWTVMAVLILYALAGGLGGGGPLSNAKVAAVDGSARVRYEKFARQLTPTTVEVNVTQPPDGRPVQLQISGSYLSVMTVRSIVPEPDAMTVADSGYVLAFKRLLGVADASIYLQLEPQKIGAAKGWIVLNNGERLSINQFVLP